MRLGDRKVGDLMTPNPVTIAPEQSLSDALGRMKAHDVHELPVVEDGHLVGLLSYHTLLKRRGLPGTTRVSRVATPPPEIAPGDELTTVADLLATTGFRALPVVVKGKLAGLISRSDLVHIVADLEEVKDLRVESIMTPSPRTVAEDDTVLQAREVLRGAPLRSVPVVDRRGRLVGVVGVKDLARALWTPAERESEGDTAGERFAPQLRVGSIMSSPAISVAPRASVAAAAALMDEHRISSVVVVEDGKPVGVVGQGNLLELLATFRQREGVFVQITGLEEQPYVFDDLYALIEKKLQRLSPIVRPQTLTIHVGLYSRVSDRLKYSMAAKMGVGGKVYYAKAVDWDPHATLSELLDQLERRVKKEKDRAVARRRGGPTRRR